MLRRSLFIIILTLFVTNTVWSQDAATPPDYFAEAMIDNPTPYVGQQIIYRFRFYTAVEVTNPQYEAPDFEGFWRIDRRAVNNGSQLINNRQYLVTELDTSLYPTRSGLQEILPAHVLLPETVFRSEEKLAANALTIEVMPLPENAPPDFNGAVGQFNLTATIDRQSAPLGEPFTLRLSISGTGNVEQLTLPELPIPPDWRVYSNPTTFTVTETDDLVVGEKVYEYLLIPGQVGTQTLPGITFDYFDPAAKLYRSANTQPVTLEILPSAQANIQSSPTPIENEVAMVATPLPLKTIDSTLQTASTIPGGLFWLLWLLPPIGAGSCWWWIWQQKRNRLRVSLSRQSAALEQAQISLRNVSKTASSENYHVVRVVIINYFADKLGYTTKDLKASDVEKILEETSLSANLRKRVLLCLEWADEGQYAGTGSIDLPTLVTRTIDTLTVLDNNWKAK